MGKLDQPVKTLCWCSWWNFFVLSGGGGGENDCCNLNKKKSKFKIVELKSSISLTFMIGSWWLVNVYSLLSSFCFTVVTVYVWCDEIEQNRRLYTLVIFFHHFSSTKYFTPKNRMAPPAVPGGPSVSLHYRGTLNGRSKKRNK